MKDKLCTKDKMMIAKRSITESQVSLAKEYGVTQQAISQCLTKKEQREIIKIELSKMVAALPDILGQQLKEIKNSHKLMNSLLDPSIENDSMLEGFDEIMSLRKYCQTNERELMRSMGVLPTQTTNQYIQQIYNDNRNSIIDDKVLKYLGLKNQEENDVDETVIELTDEDITIIDD